MASLSDSGAASSDPQPARTYRYRFEDVDYDEADKVLRVGGMVVAVEPVPLTLLSALLRRPNEVVPRGELLDEVWQGRPTVEHVLASAVSKLRKALGAAGGSRISNQARVGYRFSGPLERIAVGRRPVETLHFSSGQPVPGRDGMRLERRLGTADGAIQVWRARDAGLHLTRIFKFALGGDALKALEREYTIWRALHQQLGERPDFMRIQAANLAQVPYYLECTDGGSDLAAWAAQDGQLESLSREGRIALFLHIASAVAAAHGVGVLHQDLKPANVLVSGSGDAMQVRLTDFGHSRLLEPGRLAELGITALGMTVGERPAGASPAGTPLYLAPELLAGAAPSPSSDVYALGLMLYQLLIGDFRRPLSTGWQREIDDPLLVEDISAATEGRPLDRLASAEELARRLRSLASRRAANAERLREEEAAQRRRNARARRPWLAAAGLGLGLALAASTWFFVQVRASRHEAAQATETARAINDFLSRDVLQSSDIQRVAPDRPHSMLELLNRASGRASLRFQGQPKAEASVRRQLGEAYLRLLQQARARAEFERAIALLTPRVAANDSELLMARFQFVRTLSGRYEVAEAREMLEAAEAAAGPELLKGHTALAYEASLARFDLLMDAGQADAAVPLAEGLVKRADLLDDPDNQRRFEARARLSEAYLAHGDQAKADALLAQLMQPPFGEASAGPVVLAGARLQLGRQRINEGRLDEAHALLSEVRDTLTKAFGPHEVHVAKADSELADLEQKRGNLDAALFDTEAAIQAFEASLGAQHSYTLISRANKALLEVDLGEPALALRLLDEVQPAIAADARLAPVLPGMEFGRARALTRIGRPAQALAILRKLDAGALAQSSWGRPDQRWQLQAEIGLAERALGDRARGQRDLQAGIAGIQAAGGEPWIVAHYKALLNSAQVAANGAGLSTADR